MNVGSMNVILYMSSITFQTQTAALHYTLHYIFLPIVNFQYGARQHFTLSQKDVVNWHFTRWGFSLTKD